MVFNNPDLVVYICKYLTLSDIDRFQLVNKGIATILISNKAWITQDENHTPIAPHGLVIIDEYNMGDMYGWPHLHVGDVVRYKEGRVHSENDLPAIVRSNGTREWLKNDKRHRDGDLPALISNSLIMWFQYDKLHRDNNLPAIIWIFDSSYAYYRHGIKYTPFTIDE